MIKAIVLQNMIALKSQFHGYTFLIYVPANGFVTLFLKIIHNSPTFVFQKLF